MSPVIANLKQLVSEENGQWSSTRSALYLVLGLVGTEVAAGRPLTWIHVALVGVAFVAKVAQKALEVRSDAG